MSLWMKIGAVAFAAAVFFFGGYRFAAALYQSDIDELKASHALALTEKQKEISANERKQTEALSAAWDAYESAKEDLAESRAASADLRIELERVRQLAERHRAGVSASGANSCNHCEARLDRCVGLLEEGAGLVAEGAELSQRVSVKHDAAVKIHATNRNDK